MLIKEGDDKMNTDALREGILSCRDCRELFGYEPNPIYNGQADSKIMQISQAPSLLVHETGKAFNDLSGKRLRESWYQISGDIFYNPKYFYITSTAHCYPGKNPHGGDRKPPGHCSEKWLRRELEAVDNKLYILIGKYASDYFFPKSSFTENIFLDHRINGKPAYILPHPSPLNVKWFKDHPEFEKERMPHIRRIVHETLDAGQLTIDN